MTARRHDLLPPFRQAGEHFIDFMYREGALEPQLRDHHGQHVHGPGCERTYQQAVIHLVGMVAQSYGRGQPGEPGTDADRRELRRLLMTLGMNRQEAEQVYYQLLPGAESLVGKYWPAIAALATALAGTPSMTVGEMDTQLSRGLGRLAWGDAAGVAAQAVVLRAYGAPVNRLALDTTNEPLFGSGTLVLVTMTATAELLRIVENRKHAIASPATDRTSHSLAEEHDSILRRARRNQLDLAGMARCCQRLNMQITKRVGPVPDHLHNELLEMGDRDATCVWATELAKSSVVEMPVASWINRFEALLLIGAAGAPTAEVYARYMASRSEAQRLITNNLVPISHVASALAHAGALSGSEFEALLASCTDRPYLAA